MVLNHFLRLQVDHSCKSLLEMYKIYSKTIARLLHDKGNGSRPLKKQIKSFTGTNHSITQIQEWA